MSLRVWRGSPRLPFACRVFEVSGCLAVGGNLKQRSGSESLRGLGPGPLPLQGPGRSRSLSGPAAALGPGAGPRWQPGRGRPRRLGRNRSAPSFSQGAHQRLHYAGTPSKLISAAETSGKQRSRTLEPSRVFELKLCFGQETGHL